MTSIETNYERLYPKFKESRPHVEINYNADALNGKEKTSEKTIGILGQATNGEPDKIYKVSDMVAARNIFGSGELLDALELIWSPGGSLKGGGTVYAMRVEDATPAVLDVGALHFTSNVFGELSNQTKVGLARNPINNSYRITVDYKPNGYTQVYDNLGQMFKLGYKPNDPTNAKATYTVEKAADGTAKKFILNITDTDSPVTTTTTTSTSTSTTSTSTSTSTSTTSTSTSTTTSTTAKPTTTSTTSTSTTTSTTATPAITAVRFDTNAASVKTGDEVQLSWVLDPTGVTPKDVSFATDNKAAATVDNNGRVTTLADGIANITVTVTNASGSTVSDTIKLTIAADATTDADIAKATDFALAATDPASDANPLITTQTVFDLTTQDYQTMFQLMNGLSLIPNVEVHMLTTGDNSFISASVLDEATDVDIIKDINDIDTCVYVWAVAGSISNALAYDTYINVTTKLDQPIPDPFPLTALAGGETEDTPISWASKLAGFAQVPCYFLVPLTESSAVHAEAKTFVNDIYLQGNPMKTFVGAGINEQPGSLIARQVRLKDQRVALFGTSAYRTMQDGRTLHLPGYMIAALAAGVDSGLQIGGALTNKYPDLVSIDQELTSEQYDMLNENGVIMINSIRNRGETGGYRFVQDVTTDNSTNEPVKARISLGEITDFLFFDLRMYLEKNYIGTNIRTSSADVLKNAVDAFLYNEKLDVNGLIVDYDSDDIFVVIDGNTAWITFTVAPSQTLDNILVYGAYTNYTATSSNTNGSITIDANGIPVQTTNSTTSANTSITNSQNPDINAGYSFGTSSTVGSSSSTYGTISHDSANGIYN